MLKFIQKWPHNNILKKYGFGWLHREFFTFPNTFDRWLCVHDRSLPFPDWVELQAGLEW